MKREECACEEKDSKLTCQDCDKESSLPYWCETCERRVSQKRCLGCGLKARKIRRLQS